MSRVVTVTQRYVVDGEIAQEQTFPITDLTRIDGVGCPPIQITGFGSSTLSVQFTFDPPLIVPDGE